MKSESKWIFLSLEDVLVKLPCFMMNFPLDLFKTNFQKYFFKKVTGVIKNFSISKMNISTPQFWSWNTFRKMPFNQQINISKVGWEVIRNILVLISHNGHVLFLYYPSKNIWIILYYNLHKISVLSCNCNIRY